MAFKIGNETYNRIYISNDKNNLRQNLATSLTFGDNNVTTFRDSNTFETPSIWAYDERVLSKSNSAVTFLGDNVNDLSRSFGTITCGYVVRKMEFSYTTNSERDIGNIINHNERLFAFRIGTDDKINSSNRFGNYIFSTLMNIRVDIIILQDIRRVGIIMVGTQWLLIVETLITVVIVRQKQTITK